MQNKTMLFAIFAIGLNLMATGCQPGKYYDTDIPEENMLTVEPETTATAGMSGAVGRSIPSTPPRQPGGD